MDIKRIGIAIMKLPPNLQRQLNFFRKILKKEKFETDLITPSGIYSLDSFNLHKQYNWNHNKYKSQLKLLRNCSLYTNYDKGRILMNFLAETIPLVSLSCNIFQKNYFLRYNGEIFTKVGLNHPNKISYLKKFFSYKQSFIHASKIICLGPIGKRKLENLGFKSSKIKIIPPFINKEVFHPVENKQKYRSKADLPLKGKLILFVGRLSRLKGAHFLEKIIREVKNENDKINFCIVGEGKYREKLREYENVVSTGRVSFEEIDKLYKASNLLILPSLTEGLPNAILEALACGLPVAARGVGEIPWLVSNICNNAEEFTEFILSEEWEVDELAIIFKPENIAERYKKLFQSI